MKHIDEGRLSEYLDALQREQEGQSGRAAERQETERHLSECAECSALLEEVQLLRDRASALLREAVPARVSMPAFEEIEARARAVGRGVPRQAPKRVFAMNRLAALGWAATLVLAVGVGWLARGSLNFGSPELEEYGQREAVSREAPAAAEVASGAAEADSGAQVETVPSHEARRLRSAQEPVEEAAAQVTLPAAVDERLEMAVAPPPEPGRRDVLAEPPVDVAAPEPPAAAKADPQRDAAARQAIAGITAEEREGEALGRGAAPDPRAQLNEAFATAMWAAVNLAEAERHVGGELRTVNGIPVDSVRIGEVDGRPAASILQTLPSGEQLEIVQWHQEQAENWVSVGAVAQVSADQAPVERPEARAAERPAELMTSVIRQDGFLLALRAPVSADSLAALAARIR